jgi:hypothetical protein
MSKAMQLKAKIKNLAHKKLRARSSRIAELHVGTIIGKNINLKIPR